MNIKKIKLYENVVLEGPGEDWLCQPGYPLSIKKIYLLTLSLTVKLGEEWPGHSGLSTPSIKINQESLLYNPLLPQPFV